MQAIDEKILSRFYGRGRGHVVTQKDFIDLGSRSHIDNALSRLAQSGKLRRIAQGPGMDACPYPGDHEGLESEWINSSPKLKPPDWL